MKKIEIEIVIQATEHNHVVVEVPDDFDTKNEETIQKLGRELGLLVSTNWKVLIDK